jgi:hypothetical protein
VDEATRSQALDVIMVIVAVAALMIGLISMLIGKISAWLDTQSVNHSQAIMSPAPAQTTPDQQTDEADRPADARLSGDPRRCYALQLDRTKAGLITVLVYNEWSVSEIRGVLKGDNTVLGQEIAEARERLGMLPAGEYRTPIAGRPTAAVFETGDLAYEPPSK